ncbi:SGNH/GDSL hydrolase family protein [Paenibacillus sp. NPDC058071]|uniref:SGNH/GDSL hydrolase family protein n=1 Tax=Paenibacillus sp. NPDC058071 TaxID=3346326 RepID=UPI0036DE3415
MKLICLGDSITEGLGVIRTGKSYPSQLAHRLRSRGEGQVELYNFGASAKMLDESIRRHEKEIIRMQPDIVIVAHGVTEAIVRPKPAALRLFPPRWRKPGWMDPRPYYSKNRYKKTMQRIESAIRWRCKWAAIRLFGGIAWMSPSEFRNYLDPFITRLLNESPSTHLILLTPIAADPVYFPSSGSSLEAFRQQIDAVAWRHQRSGSVHRCDTSALLRQWEDYWEDRFHPNEAGHQTIADELYAVIEASRIGLGSAEIKEGVR